jgi:hypothetical protein
MAATADLRAFLSSLGHAEAAGVTEVCVFQEGDVPTHLGYFSDLDAAVKAIAAQDGRGNIFVTLNPAIPAMLARANNRLVEGSFKKKLKRTKDTEIHRDCWFVLDVDPERPSGISSTNDEKREAHEVAKAVRDWLLSIGVPTSAIMTCDSGNGAYVIVRTLDCKLTDEHIDRKKSFLNFVADQFDAPQVKIDRTVYNPARLIGALGAMKVKGEDIPERPHRRSAVFTVAGEPFDPAKEQRCEPFDLYDLAVKIMPGPNTNAKTGAQSTKGNGKVWFDCRLIADKLSNPKQTANGFTKYDCPNCRHPGKFWIKEVDGKSGCYESSSVCDWRKLRDKIREIALAAGIEVAAQSNGAKAEEDPLDLKVRRMADVQVESVDWLWNLRIARGYLTIVEGIEGEGKSTVLVAIAAAVTCGQGLKDMVFDGPGNVLWLSAEDGLSTMLKPRLLSAGADCTRVFASEQPFTLDDKGFQALREQLAIHRPTMVVIDPVFAYTKGDPSKGADARACTNLLKQLAEEFDCAIVLVRHLGKSKGNGDPRVAGLYSIEWRAAARSVLVCGSDPDDASKRAIAQSKNNLGPFAESVGYKISPDASTASGARFEWLGVSDLTAKRILATPESEDRIVERADAKTWLQEFLKSGEKKAVEVITESRAEKISKRTLDRAKADLRIKSRCEGYQPKIWFWRLSEERLEEERLEEERLEEELTEDCQPPEIAPKDATLTDVGNLRVNGGNKGSYGKDLLEGCQPPEAWQPSDEKEQVGNLRGAKAAKASIRANSGDAFVDSRPAWHTLYSNSTNNPQTNPDEEETF